jgi:adenylate cyclase class 2
MAVESELKLHVEDLDQLRERLRGSGAELLHGPLREVNLLFDSSDNVLATSGRALRLRTIGDRHLLTFKGVARYLGQIKQREEIEVELRDHDSMVGVLARLGFSRKLRYDKDRESWRLGAVMIALDHTPLGDFAEVDGPEAELDRVARLIGLDPCSAIRDSYPGLWQKHRSRHPELQLPSDMVFTE